MTSLNDKLDRRPIEFQEIKVVRFKLGAAVKRIYSCDNEVDASMFALRFSGIHYEYLPGIYRVII